MDQQKKMDASTTTEATAATAAAKDPLTDESTPFTGLHFDFDSNTQSTRLYLVPNDDERSQETDSEEDNIPTTTTTTTTTTVAPSPN